MMQVVYAPQSPSARHSRALGASARASSVTVVMSREQVSLIASSVESEAHSSLARVMMPSRSALTLSAMPGGLSYLARASTSAGMYVSVHVRLRANTSTQSCCISASEAARCALGGDAGAGAASVVPHAAIATGRRRRASEIMRVIGLSFAVLLRRVLGHATNPDRDEEPRHPEQEA